MQWTITFGHRRHSPHTHVGVVLLAVDDAQQGGRLVVFEVQSHVVHGGYWKEETHTEMKDSCVI